MRLGISPLLVRKPTLGEARKTMNLALSAARRGDLRLGVSRAITAIAQASIVGYLAKGQSGKLAADNVIQDARGLIQGIVVERARVDLRKLG